MPMSKVQFIARPWYSCDSTAMLLFQVRHICHDGHLIDYDNVDDDGDDDDGEDVDVGDDNGNDSDDDDD